MESDLRLAVLAALIREHGPIPCVYVETPVARNLLHDPVRFEVKAGDLRVRFDDTLVVDNYDGPRAALPQPVLFSSRAEARDRCALLGSILRRVNVGQTTPGSAMPPTVVQLVLAQLNVTPGAVEIGT